MSYPRYRTVNVAVSYDPSMSVTSRRGRVAVMLFPDCFKSAEICDLINGSLLDRLADDLEQSRVLLDALEDETEPERRTR
jgi:hypothetical protein